MTRAPRARPGSFHRGPGCAHHPRFALLRRKSTRLAQSIDVLEGTMSLVGPRPELPRYVALYPAGCAREVLSVRPGITDFASIEYRDESIAAGARSTDPERTYREVVLPAKLALQANATSTRRACWTDLRLIVRVRCARFSSIRQYFPPRHFRRDPTSPVPYLFQRRAGSI